MAKVANITGTVSATFGGKSLVRVDIGERESDILPVSAQANSFKRHFTPRRVGEQIAIIGNADSGIAVGNVFHEGCREPDGSGDTCETIEYENGGRITIDTATSTITISGFDIVINGNLTVNGTITDSVGLLTDHTHTGVQSGGSNTGGRP